MFQTLASRNDDLRRLIARGYAVTCDAGYLIVRDTPYLDAAGNLQIGAIVAKLEFVDKEKVVQSDHQIFFAGSHPHSIDGTPIQNLGGGPAQLALSEASKDVVVQRSFSNKPRPAGKFDDFFAKIESYVAIICGPAMHKYGASPYTFRVVSDVPYASVFEFHDTLTSLAEIADLAARLKDDVVAVIGLGGTGSYLTDFLVKTPIKELRGFDFDSFHVHNAFRSPGRLLEDELGKPKASVYADRYRAFRKGFSTTHTRIDRACASHFHGATFAFVCVDKGSARKEIFDLLVGLGIPFIDVGMGLKRSAKGLTGMVRATYYSPADASKRIQAGLSPLTDPADDEYRTNIQISELNALNAAFAVILFKQLRGFFAADVNPYHLLFGVSDFALAGESSDED